MNIEKLNEGESVELFNYDKCGYTQRIVLRYGDPAHDELVVQQTDGGEWNDVDTITTLVCGERKIPESVLSQTTQS